MKSEHGVGRTDRHTDRQQCVKGDESHLLGMNTAARGLEVLWSPPFGVQ